MFANLLVNSTKNNRFLNRRQQKDTVTLEQCNQFVGIFGTQDNKTRYNFLYDNFRIIDPDSYLGEPTTTTEMITALIKANAMNFLYNAEIYYMWSNKKTIRFVYEDYLNKYMEWLKQTKPNTDCSYDIGSFTIDDIVGTYESINSNMNLKCPFMFASQTNYKFHNSDNSVQYVVKESELLNIYNFKQLGEAIDKYPVIHTSHQYVIPMLLSSSSGSGGLNELEIKKFGNGFTDSSLLTSAYILKYSNGKYLYAAEFINAMSDYETPESTVCSPTTIHAKYQVQQITNFVNDENPSLIGYIYPQDTSLYGSYNTMFIENYGYKFDFYRPQSEQSSINTPLSEYSSINTPSSEQSSINTGSYNDEARQDSDNQGNGKSPTTTIVVILSVCLGVAIIGVAGYCVYSHMKNNDKDIEEQPRV